MAGASARVAIRGWMSGALTAISSASAPVGGVATSLARARNGFLYFNDAQNLASVNLYPWLLAPMVPVIIVILAFNFVGDGLRDAADPYH